MDPNVDSQSAQNPPDTPTTPTKFDRAKFLSAKIKTGVKRLVGHDDSDADTEDDGDVSDLFQDAAFNSQQIVEATPQESGSLRDKLRQEAHGWGEMIKSPRRAMRNKYTRRVAANLSVQPAAYDRECDEDLVDAYDALDRANADPDYASDRDSDSSARGHPQDKGASDLRDFEAEIDGTDMASGQVEFAKAKIRKAEAQRDSLRAAWILGRQVKRVRVTRPMSRQPQRQDYVIEKESGQKEGMQWDRYLAAMALWHTRRFTPHHIDDFDELPFDLRELSSAIERLAVVSAPWQSFFLEVRDVYLWQDPRRTLKYAAAYWTLWYFQHIMTAAFVWIIIATVKNRFRPTEIQSIRDRVQRARGQQVKAQAWGELIQRHGEHDWIEPFLDSVGPKVQLELNDLSNLLEILQSFYRWDRPRKTTASLFFFTACFLLTALTDMRCCVKLVWMGVGVVFFVSLPVSARYPKYRRLVQPVYWVFWDIPNAAELAIVQLQEKVILRDAAKLERLKREKLMGRSSQPGASDDDFLSADELPNLSRRKNSEVMQAVLDSDQITFRAVRSTSQTHGRVRLQRHGIWYFDKEFKSHYSFSKLLEMRKVDISPANDPDASKIGRLARRIQETTSLQFLPSGIEFVFSQTPELPDNAYGPQEQQIHQEIPREERLALTVSESDRDKIFSLVLGWSNLKWQPQFTLNQRNRLSPGADNPSKRGKGNEDLDKTVKSFVH